jgi:hypothetical protein
MRVSELTVSDPEKGPIFRVFSTSSGFELSKLFNFKIFARAQKKRKVGEAFLLGPIGGMRATQISFVTAIFLDGRSNFLSGYQKKNIAAACLHLPQQRSGINKLNACFKELESHGHNTRLWLLFHWTGSN